MNKSIPEISIIIPVYNTEKYLDELVASINRQISQNFEVIFIDDGSSDGSGNLLSSACKKQSNFKYYYQNNSGQGAARNLGYTLSKGKYIMFVDSDDVLHPEYTTIPLKIIKDNKADFFQFKYVVGNNPIESYDTKLNTYNLEEIYFRKAIMDIYPIAPCSIIKKELLERSGVKFPSFKYEDNVEIPRIISYAGKVIVSDLCLYYYRHHAQSTVNTIKNRKDLISAGYAILELAKTIPEFSSEFVFRSYTVFQKYISFDSDNEKNSQEKNLYEEVKNLLEKEIFVYNPYIEIPKRMKKYYENTTSWKITKPLRMLMNYLKKFKNGN